jgi:hypothetical protein
MDIQSILARLEGRAGQFVRVETRRPVRTLKSAGNVGTVEKHMVCFVTSGTDYRNRSNVRDAIARGERGEVQPLPWGHWEKFPFVITHKDQKYVRFYPPTDMQLAYFNLVPTVEWTLNGSAISRERAMELCGSEARPSEQPAEALTFRADYILDVG